MKKIIIIEELTIFTLLFFFFLKFFFNKIYFRTLSKALEKEWVDKILKSIGFCSLGFNDIISDPLHESFEIRKKLELKFIKDRIEKNNIFVSFVKKYNTNSEKFKLCLRGELTSADNTCYHIESGSIALINKYKLLEKNKIYYFTNKISSYLLLKNHHNKIKVSTIYFLFSFAFYFFLKLITIIKKKIPKKSLKNNFLKNAKKKIVNIKNFKIIYFIHHGLRYGEAYNKTHIYNNNKKSKINKDNILSIVTGTQDQFTKRFFSFWNMPNINFKDYKETTNLKKEFFLYQKIFLKNIFNIYELVLSFFIIVAIIQIKKNLNFFNNLPNLKTIICDYDILFDKKILIACDIKKIKTIAIQERFAVNTLISPLFFNYYFISGEKFESYFNEYGYLVDKYYPIGVIRSSVFKNRKKLLIKNEYLRLSKINKKIILFVGIDILNKFKTRFHGEDGSSIKNNIFFFKELIDISKRLKDCHFIIRLKNYNNLHLMPKYIIDELKYCKNIEMDTLGKINIYHLINLCNLVISRQTSVIEECISDDIPVVVLDEMNFLSNYTSYPLHKLFVNAKNSEELNMYIDKFYQGECLYDETKKNELRKYLC